jgi:hypothetical protein
MNSLDHQRKNSKMALRRDLRGSKTKGKQNESVFHLGIWAGSRRSLALEELSPQAFLGVCR